MSERINAYKKEIDKAYGELQKILYETCNCFEHCADCPYKKKECNSLSYLLKDGDPYYRSLYETHAYDVEILLNL